MPPPRVGLEERGTPMLDARKARILAKENEEGRAYTQARAPFGVPSSL